MRKSFVLLLVALAVIVLVSPGIVGRLAERTMDENLDWAASESSDLDITSQRFDRGWFSSAGQHRIEVREGDLRDLLVAVFEPEDPAGLPALVIDTTLDHGLIPVASMTREQGSLVPGLGSAVSTLAVEFPGGETFPVPGSIYSHIGLTGELESNYVLEAGSFEADGGTLTWGASDVVLTSSPTDGRLGLRGSLAPLSAESTDLALLLGAATFEFNQAPTRFGIAVGDIEANIESIGRIEPGDSTMIGPLALSGSSSIDGKRLDAAAEIALDNAPLEPLGNADIRARLRVEGADAASLARLQRSMQRGLAVTDPQAADPLLDADLRRLLAAGFEFHVDQFDVELPSGTIAVTSHVDIAESTIDEFSWAGLLFAIDATLDISLPADVVDLITVLNPEANTIIALGYLRREGENFIVEASLENGRIMINGAPMQIPLDSFR